MAHYDENKYYLPLKVFWKMQDAADYIRLHNKDGNLALHEYDLE